jgi:hypothetical protein
VRFDGAQRADLFVDNQVLDALLETMKYSATSSGVASVGGSVER